MNENEGASEGEATTPAADESQPDPVTNVKAEMQRKFGNIEAEMKRLAEANEQLTRQLSAGTKPAPAAEEPDEELLYNNPKEFKKRLTQSVKSEVYGELEAQNRAAAERQQTVLKLVAEYPALNNLESEMYQETLRALETLPKHMQASAAGYETAVYKAAASLGLQPKSRQKAKTEDGDNFSFSGSKSGAPKKSTAKPDLDPKILFTAQMMGIDVNDPKELEELKKYTKKNFSRFE